MNITTPNPLKTRDRPSKVKPNKPNRPKTRKRAGPPTPLLRWKFNDEERQSSANVAGDESSPPEQRREKVAAAAARARARARVSARKLGAAHWRGHVAESADLAERKDPLGFKLEVGHGGDRLPCHHASRERGSEAKDPLRSPCSVNGPINGYLCEGQSPFLFSNYAMEGATKWDPVCSKESNENSVDLKALEQKASTASLISALEAELKQAQVRIEVLESERRSSKKKLEHFLKKLSEERAAWRRREHEKVRAIMDDVKTDLSRERKNRQRLEIVNSKLVNELAEAKLSAKRYMQEYEKERKARELIEEVCDELAKEIGEDKAEVDSLQKECIKVREEVEDERKMLHMAEVWREERVQMKLIDAKVVLDQKYSQMNQIVAELEGFLMSKGASLDADEKREIEMLQQVAATMNIQDIKEFTYEPSNSDDIFAVVKEMAVAESNEKDIEPCIDYSPASNASEVHTVSPEFYKQSNGSLHRLSSEYVNQNGDIDDDGSGWETVSHAEDHGSSYSPDGSIMSVDKMCQDSNISGSCSEWEEQVGDETPITEISEICSAQPKQVKKVKSITRLWRSCPNNGDNYKIISVDGVNGKLSNGRVSSEVVMSPDHGSGKGGISPSNMMAWGSPESGNPHINKGMKGCIEWSRGQKNSLKHKLLEARMESQKIQLRQVLKQKS